MRKDIDVIARWAALSKVPVPTSDPTLMDGAKVTVSDRHGQVESGDDSSEPSSRSHARRDDCRCVSKALRSRYAASMHARCSARAAPARCNFNLS